VIVKALLALVEPLVGSAAQRSSARLRFLQGIENRLGTLGILLMDPQLRHRLLHRDAADTTEAFAHESAANALTFERLPPAISLLSATGGHQADQLFTVGTGHGLRLAGEGITRLPAPFRMAR
jgi:hypothetical protein